MLSKEELEQIFEEGKATESALEHFKYCAYFVTRAQLEKDLEGQLNEIMPTVERAVRYLSLPLTFFKECNKIEHYDADMFFLIKSELQKHCDKEELLAYEEKFNSALLPLLKKYFDKFGVNKAKVNAFLCDALKDLEEDTFYDSPFKKHMKNNAIELIKKAIEACKEEQNEISFSELKFLSDMALKVEHINCINFYKLLKKMQPEKWKEFKELNLKYLTFLSTKIIEYWSDKKF